MKTPKRQRVNPPTPSNQNFSFQTNVAGQAVIPTQQRQTLTERLAELESLNSALRDQIEHPGDIPRMAQLIKNDLESIERSQRHIYNLENELSNARAELVSSRMNHLTHMREFDNLTLDKVPIKA